MLDRIYSEQVGRVRDRLRAVLLVKRGVEPEAAARSLDRGRDFARRWTARWDEQGYEGLVDRPRSGAPTKLAPEKEQAFLARLDQPRTLGSKALRGHDIRRILETEFGAAYSKNGVYDLLERLGRSCLSPRPRHPKACSAEEHRKWEKETAPLLSGR